MLPAVWDVSPEKYMNSCKIAYDGRITFWNAKLQSIQRPKAKSTAMSAEGRLFFSLCPEGKRRFLLSGMGLSHVINSDVSSEGAPRAKRGARGITCYGRSLIRSGAQVLEDRHGLKCLTFLTATLPESALVAYTPLTWAAVVNRFQKSLRRLLKRASLSEEIVGCVELQPGRLLKSSGLPTPHLHLVFQGRERGKSWFYRPEVYLKAWERACRSVWFGSREYQASVRVESLRSSSVSYLGKYMSKGGDVLTSCDPSLLPSSWYTISATLKSFVKRSEFRVSGEAAHDLYYWLKDHDFLLWVRDVWSHQCADGSYFLMAWIGAIKGRSKYWEIVQGMRELVKRRSLSDPLRFSSLFPVPC